ncbi:hypothetical protein FF011L_26670 [Roseimaritima multifibrata]|uniref:Uncharacterized protein n=1 Tax=Roseimaritima multifibrata TaxID=1930274 RepID=A0A517MG77_9BACT|nr:hypothetical protein [Roseimaritima multifibrata]QDS93891.1 hypothetical protein FF011L_26670 [Roseimaritima multifibrata]
MSRLGDSPGFVSRDLGTGAIAQTVRLLEVFVSQDSGTGAIAQTGRLLAVFVS